MARTTSGRTAHRRGHVAHTAPLQRHVQASERYALVARLAPFCLVAATILALILNLRWVAANVSGDVQLYHCYAHAFWRGAGESHVLHVPGCADIVRPRFQTFPQEYPAPALALFAVPLVMPWWSYAVSFGVCIAVVTLLATAVLAWRRNLEAAIAFPLYVLAAGWFFALERYDLVPGLCVLIALVCLERGNLRLATVALAIGTMLKIFPVVLFPLILIAGRRRDQGSWRADLVGIFAGICAVGFLPALLANAGGALSPLHYEFARSLHIESIAGSLFWYASKQDLGPAPFTPGGPTVGTTFSVDVIGGPQFAWAAVFVIAGITGILLAYRRAWHGWDSPGRSFIVVLLCVLLASKVFSTQYLLWILPVAAYCEGVRFRWLLLCILTAAIMNSYYTRTVSLALLPQDSSFIGLIVVRNLLVCGLALLYLLTPGDIHARHWPTKPVWRYVWYDYLIAPS